MVILALNGALEQKRKAISPKILDQNGQKIQQFEFLKLSRFCDLLIENLENLEILKGSFFGHCDPQFQTQSDGNVKISLYFLIFAPERYLVPKV